MFTFSSYEIISWFFVYFIIGANLYVLDKKFGVSIYNKWKKYTSSNMEEYKDDYTKGFIYNRRTRVKILWASNISLLLSISVFIGGYSPLPVEIVMFFLEIPVTFAGILVGPFYAKILRMSEKTVDQLDNLEKRVENGDIENSAKEIVDKTKEEVSDTFENITKTVKETVASMTSSEEKPKETPKTKVENYSDANNAINDILGKK